MHFEAPLAFFLLLGIPIMLFLRYRTRGLGSLRFSSTRHARQLQHSFRQRLAGLPVFIRVLALIFLTLAMARPQEGRERVRDVSHGIAIEMVVDRSGSMGAEMDFAGERLNRLEVVKQVFDEFVTGRSGNLSGRPNDMIGLVAFARYADTVAPLTLAHGALAEFIKNVQLVKRKNEDGTAIGDAIALAASRLQTAEETIKRQAEQGDKGFQIKSKIIILLTDGQSNAGKRTPAEAAALAKDWGIKIYTIGVGGNEGLMRQQSLFGSFLVQMGEGVDRKTLQSLADTTGGIFRLADDGEALRAVYREIDELEKSEVESIRYLDFREMFQPFLFIALGLLLLEIALVTTVFRKIP
jgi:Ca-activated chloride channel family protein